MASDGNNNGTKEEEDLDFLTRTPGGQYRWKNKRFYKTIAIGPTSPSPRRRPSPIYNNKHKKNNNVGMTSPSYPYMTEEEEEATRRRGTIRDSLRGILDAVDEPDL